MLKLVLELPLELIETACVTPLSVIATSSPPGAADPAAMWPFTVTVAVPALTDGDARLLNAGVALLITSVLVSHLLLRRWWSKAVVLLLVFPLAVFKNGLRIVTLCLLTLYVDERFFEDR